MRTAPWVPLAPPRAVVAFAALLAACDRRAPASPSPTPVAAAVAPQVAAVPRVEPPTYDPIAPVHASAWSIDNKEATVPPQCYTKTDGFANPCWTCHASGRGPHTFSDWELQKSYAFSDFARDNRWKNLHADRRAAIAAISDDEILAWVRADNYNPLRAALRSPHGYAGFRPDVDLDRGFDEEGFARDGSGWRALRYKPFPGAFWPTNGSTDDVFIRLPPAFRTDETGKASRPLYRANFALLEAAMTVEVDEKGEGSARINRVVDPVDERLAAMDLDGDGAIGTAARVRKLPPNYLGGAKDVILRPLLYPVGTEFLHSVRYIDPDADSRIARRMKELRYSRKIEDIEGRRRDKAYRIEEREKAEGMLPKFLGSPERGYRNVFGWLLQAFIEDAQGRLRLQNAEEQLFCMGCHSHLGVTIDNTFSFPRKAPGAAGWRYQDIAGIPDLPQVGHEDPEVLTYLRRVGGGDELRANDEILARFFPKGRLDEKEVRRAAVGGDRDLRHLVVPSRERALKLDKAYLVLVREQTFARGRDAVVAPAKNVFTRIDTFASTQLAKKKRIFSDGNLLLRWPE